MSMDRAILAALTALEAKEIKTKELDESLSAAVGTTSSQQIAGALTSHGRGRWFDPSIAHSEKVAF